MSFTQLNPQIPVVTPKGHGWAFGVIDRSQEHPIEFVVAQDNGGEVWVWLQQDIRVAVNRTYHRIPDTTFSLKGQSEG